MKFPKVFFASLKPDSRFAAQWQRDYPRPLARRWYFLNSAELVKQWLAAINGHDVIALAMLMAADHVFVDSVGNRVHSAKSMEAGWRGYFAMCPDYWIRVDHMMVEDDTVLAAGEAGGTIHQESWRTPAAWKAVIRDGKVVEWQVFADNKPVYEILGKRQRKALQQRD